MKILKLNSKGIEVVKLQQNLTKLGFYTKDDGNFGLFTRLQVENFQRKFKLKDDGIVGKNTLNKINEQLKIIDKLKKIPIVNELKVVKEENLTHSFQSLFTLQQLKLIIDFEVGQGKSYYDKYLIKPTLPPAASGCTIMIGIDLRFTPLDEFHKMMKPAVDQKILTVCQYNKLLQLIGIKPTKSQVNALSDIKIPYEYALDVFLKYTVPKFYKITTQTFPGVQNLKWQAQVALLSIVFNRGGSLKGNKRIYMRAIRDLVPLKDYKKIAQNIRNMKSWWPTIRGLRRRRDAEADLVLEKYI
jgi:hypothetical protein